MAFTFDATDGGANANSLCSIEFADGYFAGELYAAEWTALNSSVPNDLLKKEIALVKATRRLERIEWIGFRLSSAQRLKHPRSGLFDDDGYYYDPYSVIRPIREATCDLALYYLKQDPTEIVDKSLKQFKNLRIAGAIEMEMRDSLPNEEELPPAVLGSIYRWMQTGAGGIRIQRG